MSQYTSYYLYQKYEQRDGQAPIPVYPNVFSVDGDGTMPKVVKQNNDPNCGYIPSLNLKFKATYSDSSTYSAGCDSNTTLTIETTKPSGYYYSAMTTAEIGDCVISTEINLFKDCINLSSITIADSVHVINGCVFLECHSLQSVRIPDNCDYIGRLCFGNCYSLSAITNMPDNLTVLYDNTFVRCSGLTELHLPDSLEEIHAACFAYCSSLSELTVPSGVTTIGGSAFANCSGLTKITFLSTTPPTLLEGEPILRNTNDCPIYVPSGSVEAYRNASGWSTYASRITAIPLLNLKFKATYSDSSTYSEECDSASTLTTATTKPSGYDYSAMTTAEIGECITSIDQYAFRNCTGLTSVTIPDGVTSIGSYAFYQCFSLTSIDIPTSVTSIGNYAFQYCSSLTSINIPSGVTSIGQNTFYGCNSLTSVTIPNSATSIGNQAFRSCSGLISIVIPDSVTSIGNSAFNECSGLTSINIPSGVTSINNNVFQKCTGLTSVTIPDSVTSIGDYAFNNCRSLTSIDIPSGVTSIGTWAFYGCSGLTSITVNATTPPTLGSSILGNTNDCPIYVPSGSVEVYKTTSGWSNYSSRIQAIP